MKIIIFYDMTPCFLVYKYTDVSEQPAEEEVHHDDEENRYYLLNVCVKVKNGD
jgi:hypothetical protein